MRIVVNDFAANMGGATSILISFYDYLISSKDENEWFFLLSDNYISTTEKIHVVLLPKEKKSRIRRLLFDVFYGRQVINRIKPDAVFYLQNTFISGVKVPQIAYMDQPIPFQSTCKFSLLKNEERSLAIYQYFIGYFIKKACKKADGIIVQTEWMKQAIVNQCGVDENKIIKNKPQVVDDKLITSDFYDNTAFIYPSSGAFYKNHRCIINAVKLLEKEKLPDYTVEFTLDEKELYNGIKEIKCVGKLKHEDVMKKLSKQVLLFPSYIETYGLPLAEARNVNSIILAADTEFSREILDGYENAYFFNPFRPDELAYLMSNVISGNITRVICNYEDKDEDSGWEEVIKLIQDKVNSIGLS